jgi:hypothetical protein
MSRSLSLAIVFAVTGVISCAVDDREGRDSQSSIPEQESASAAYSCGVSPTSITYWASEWARDVIDADGMIGGCVFDESCVPSCSGGTSDWTSWSGPLIQCPCH